MSEGSDPPHTKPSSQPAVAATGAGGGLATVIAVLTDRLIQGDPWYKTLLLGLVPSIALGIRWLVVKAEIWKDRRDLRRPIDKLREDLQQRIDDPNFSDEDRNEYREKLRKLNQIEIAENEERIEILRLRIRNRS